jgi:hypothetical protein
MHVDSPVLAVELDVEEMTSQSWTVSAKFSKLPLQLTDKVGHSCLSASFLEVLGLPL